ncbi:ABC transporter permease [Priestia aryabhattai]|uniref:ABC transporter permease n=1 Tax=Priestia aryabhattai TaxID=412384 RepID=UPI002E1F3049|nr:ABC transporter permease [Priestia aryabhattai]
MNKLYRTIKERMIKIEKYYFHYNKRDNKNYVNQSYPQKKKKNDKYVNSSSFIDIDNSSSPLIADELVINSAFRATNIFNKQGVLPFTSVKVFFPNEQFDLGNNEYNSATSTFFPEVKGLYSFSASVVFDADDPFATYQLTLAFSVNKSIVSINNNFIGFTAENSIIEVNDILQLKAGDQVEVIIRSTTSGTIIPNNNVRFAGARLPSPKI